MAEYDTWNRALIDEFVDGTPLGAPVFLASDDDAIARIGRRLLDDTNQGADAIVADFLRAVRSRVVRDRGRVDLSDVQELDAEERPRCVGFLAALVLAASRMQEADDRPGNDFFDPLRELLGLPMGEGRPSGMESGSEERLWRQWNFWLQVQGHLPTAQTEGKGATKYIGYARSQALLRRVDRDQLIRLFSTRGWRGDLDADGLLLRIQREAPSLTVHLRRLLDADSERQQAVAEAFHDLYESWRDDPTGAAAPRGLRTRHLYAGLYRVADSFGGVPTYYLYPRAPRGAGAPPMSVRLQDGSHALLSERPGWYRPLAPVDSTTLVAGVRYPIEQPADAETLILPQRAFWVFVRDPDDPDSGVEASWGSPRLGVPFTLLCMTELAEQVRALREENLLLWQDDPQPVLDSRWVEFRDCLVVSEAWSGAHFGNPELYDALRPADRCSISLSGGLRLPNRGGWLDGYGPRVTVFAFDAEAEVTVTHVQHGRTVLEQAQHTGEPVTIAWPGPGAYRITAVCGSQQAAPRLAQIMPWDAARLALEPGRMLVTIDGAQLCGAAIE